MPFFGLNVTFTPKSRFWGDFAVKVKFGPFTVKSTQLYCKCDNHVRFLKTDDKTCGGVPALRVGHIESAWKIETLFQTPLTQRGIRRSQRGGSFEKGGLF